jgi:hypothetical protein
MSIEDHFHFIKKTKSQRKGWMDKGNTQLNPNLNSSNCFCKKSSTLPQEPQVR